MTQSNRPPPIPFEGCDCTFHILTGDERLLDPSRSLDLHGYIFQCPLHAAASDLLAALEAQAKAEEQRSECTCGKDCSWCDEVEEHARQLRDEAMRKAKGAIAYVRKQGRLPHEWKDEKAPDLTP